MYSGGCAGQVAAPTRETAAQALAAALLVVPQSRLVPTMSCLGHLVGCGDWEGRHAGLLGIKYLLAARPDAAPLLLGSALSAGLGGLQVRFFVPMPILLFPVHKEENYSESKHFHLLELAWMRTRSFWACR